MKKESQALIHRFMKKPMSGSDIEERSFGIIDEEAPAHRFTPEEWQVVKRMIHTTGDFAIMDDIVFSTDAIRSAVAALKKGVPIYMDTNMIRSGLSLERLHRANHSYGTESLICYVSDADVVNEAKEKAVPRSLAAVKKAAPVLGGAIAAFGNAPVGLLEVNRMIIEEGLKPALVIAVPVGFVHVVESKDELLRLKVPFIALRGKRGGSAIAVAVLHALLSLAEQQNKESRDTDTLQKAVIIMGHGSRMPGADNGMERVAQSLAKRFPDVMVDTCSMSMLGPRFGEVFDACVARGAREIIVIPYFLHFGAHMQEDIPKILLEKATESPDVKIIMGNNLGFDEKLVDIIEKRFRESEKLEDIIAVQRKTTNRG